MKYYQIDRTSEIKIIGRKDGMSQVERIEDNTDETKNYTDFKNHFSGYNTDFWHTQDKVFALNPPVIKGRMRKNAKVTDIMWYGSVFDFLNHIYSQKYIDILKAFNISNFKTFDFKIENIPEKYYLMFIETIILEEVDFNKSTLTTGYKVTNNLKYHTVNNLLEYKDFKQKNIISTFENLAISKQYYGRDVIAVQGAGKNFYSEKLIDFLLDSGITGLQVSYNNSIQLEFV
jgi:hypothetical protein